jgi:hypothetical protein
MIMSLVTTPIASAPYRDSLFCFGPACKAGGVKPSENGRWDRIVTWKKTNTGSYVDSAGIPIPKQYILDRKTGKLYLGLDHEDMPEGPDIVAVKCFALLIGIPLYTTASLIYRGLKVIYDFVDVPLRTLKQFGQDWKTKTKPEAIKNLLKGFFWDWPGAILYSLKEAVRDVFFGSIMWLAALEGCFSPFAGRAHVADIEYKWHHKVSYKEDPRYNRDLDEWQKLSTIKQMKILWNSKAIYLTFCMQSRGNIKNPMIEKKYSIPIQVQFPDISNYRQSKA